MKERPIPFYAHEVRATLAGRKRQFRRLVKPHPAFTSWGVAGPSEAYDSLMSDDQRGAHFLVAGDHGYTDIVPCPYGQPGDGLWVRETWAPPLDGPDDGVYYDADHEFRSRRCKPAIHMPRWASRITLEVTGVRVERLQDITGADVFHEGAADEGLRAAYEICAGDGFPVEDLAEIHEYAVEDFRDLWESINGPDSWTANPWVWVVEFRRLP